MLVKDIEPISIDNVKINSIEDLYKIIELPLLEACKIFYNLGITTVMSSCNKRNVELGKYPRQRITYYTTTSETRDWSFGNGYAWILLDYDSLGETNQEYINSLCNDKNKELIELVTIPKTPNNYKSYKEEELNKLKTEDNTNPYPDNPIYQEFYQKKNPLFTTQYIERGVLLRYPINENTTVEEVNDYFTKLASTFTNNKKASKAR